MAAEEVSTAQSAENVAKPSAEEAVVTSVEDVAATTAVSGLNEEADSAPAPATHDFDPPPRAVDAEEDVKVQNLLKRFPTVAPEVVIRELENAKGHAGEAAKRLKQEVANAPDEKRTEGIALPSEEIEAPVFSGAELEVEKAAVGENCKPVSPGAEEFIASTFEEDAAPLAKAAAAEEMTKAVEEAVAPPAEEETAKAADETAKAAEETAIEAEETAKAVEEAVAAPAEEETAKAAEETAKAAEETAIDAEETEKAVEETAEPVETVPQEPEAAPTPVEEAAAPPPEENSQKSGEEQPTEGVAAEEVAAPPVADESAASPADEAAAPAIDETPAPLVEEAVAQAMEKLAAPAGEELSAPPMADEAAALPEGVDVTARAVDDAAALVVDEAAAPAAGEFSDVPVAEAEAAPSASADIIASTTEENAASPVEAPAAATEVVDEDGAKSEEQATAEAEVSQKVVEEGTTDPQIDELMAMGFKLEESREALARSSTLQEAAAVLVEKNHPPPSFVDRVMGWFGASNSANSGSEIPRPGKYKVCGCRMAVRSEPTSSEVLHYLEDGTVMEIVEIVDAEDAGPFMLIQGKMANGRWVCIMSHGRVWARQLTLVAQLVELGYSEAKAEEAAKRCSSIEAAVDFLA